MIVYVQHIDDIVICQMHGEKHIKLRSPSSGFFCNHISGNCLTEGSGVAPASQLISLSPTLFSAATTTAATAATTTTKKKTQTSTRKRRRSKQVNNKKQPSLNFKLSYGQGHVHSRHDLNHHRLMAPCCFQIHLRPPRLPGWRFVWEVGRDHGFFKSEMEMIF